MAKARKDNKGRALQKGESQRSQDNRYVFTYINLSGKRVYLYALTLRELREKEKAVLYDRLDGLDLYSAEKLDLNTLVDRYLHTKKELASSTCANYSVNYDRYCRETIGKRKIATFKYSDILLFYQELVDRGLKIGTVNTVHTVLYPAFEMAVRDDIVRTNPCTNALRQLRKREAKTMKTHKRALTIQEQNEFIRYIAEHPFFQKFKCFFVVMLGTGVRIGECSGLRWEDIDFKNRVINVNHAISYCHRGLKPPYPYEFHYDTPKTLAGVRKIPMVEQVYDVLVEEYEEQKVSGFCDMVVDGVTGFIFGRETGKPYDSGTMNHYIQKIVKFHNKEENERAKEENREPILLPHFSCHTLRHTFCTRFCENETNIKVIQSIMGHTNIHTTMDIYADITESTKKKAIEELSKNCKIF